MKKFMLYLFLISASCLFLPGCTSHKTGNNHVKICLKLDEPNASQNVSVCTGIIKDRLITYGIPEENIHFVTKNNTIEIDVDHVDNPERIILLATTPGKLEFWETYDNETAYPFLSEANKKLAETFKSSDSLFIIGNDTLNKPVKNEKNSVAKKRDSTKISLIQRIKDFRIRNEKNLKERFRKENPLFAYLQANIVQKGGKQELAQGAIVGYCDIKDTTRLNHILFFCRKKYFFPHDMKFFWSYKPQQKGSTFLELFAIKMTNRDGTPILDGSVIKDAGCDQDKMGGEEVSLTMDEKGTQLWRLITAENIGKSIAMVLDNYVYTYPIVQSEIPNGRSQITGNFTKEEAEDLATILKLHTLPAFTVVSKSITAEPK